jgi:hypothetical protein
MAAVNIKKSLVEYQTLAKTTIGNKGFSDILRSKFKVLIPEIL